jgi:hypothetical protein
MTGPAGESRPPRSFWLIGIAALLWNALGILTFVMTVTMSDAALSAMAPDERALYTEVPVWATAAYAVAVSAGTLASLGLLLRKAWAVPVFVVSLVAIVLQMGQALLASPLLEVQGPGAAILPLLIVVIAVCLVAYSRSATARGWIG